jgi:APA family basic amino acid/polyamine antiporter
VVPLLFLFASLFLLGNYLVSQPAAFAVDIGVILTGVPVYFGCRRWGAAT